MNQKKLKKEVGGTRCQIYTGSIDCLVQVCTFISFVLVLMELMIRQIHSQVALLLILNYIIVELNKVCIGQVSFFLYTPVYHVPSMITHETDL